MASSDVLQRLEGRASSAEQLISLLKLQISQIKSSHSSSSSFDEQINRLKKENAELKKEIDSWKNKLVEVEKSHGVPQIPPPVRGAAQPEAVPEPQAAVEKPAPAADQGKPDKKKKEKAASADKPEKKPQAAEEEAIHVGRLDMRVGLIRTAKRHPDADSLYVEEVDVGEDKPRTVISGLVKFIPEDQMQNRMAILLCNLKPSKMRGIASEAMVMCASTPEKVEILSAPEGSKPGDVVEVEGYVRNPDAQLNPKKKIFETCAPDLRVNDAKVATYKNVPWTVNGKHVQSQTLVNVQIK